MPFGLLLDLWECHKQYNGQAIPAHEHYIDDISRAARRFISP